VRTMRCATGTSLPSSVCVGRKTLLFSLRSAERNPGPKRDCCEPDLPRFLIEVEAPQ
jgi:hypothetical protein